MTTTSTQAERQAQPGKLPASAGASFTGKRHLRNFLLDRMQLRYTAIIVLISVALTAGLGYVVMSKAHEATKTVEVQVKTSDLDEAAQKDIIDSFYARDRLLLLSIIGFGTLLSLILAGYGIVITHKVAGPLYKISTYYAKMRDGHLGPVYNLRKGDQLQEHFEQFRTMHEALRKRTQEEVESLAKLIAGLEASGAKGEHLEALRLLKKKKEDSLS
jgi:hypothetical protein